MARLTINIPYKYSMYGDHTYYYIDIVYYKYCINCVITRNGPIQIRYLVRHRTVNGAERDVIRNKYYFLIELICGHDKIL